MKILLKIILGLVLAFTLFAVGLIVFFPKEKVKNFILEKVQEQTELPIQIDDVGLSFFPDFAFHLEGFSIGSNQHAMHVSVDDFQIKSGIRSFLGEDIHISDIIIIKPIIKVYTQHTDDEGQIDDEPSSPDKEEQQEDMDFFITNFQIEDGEIWVFDKENKEELKIVDIDQKIKIQFTDNADVRIKGKTSISEIWSKEMHMPSISIVMNKDFLLKTQEQKFEITNSSFVIQDLPIYLNGYIQNKDKKTATVDLALKTEPTELSSIFRLLPSLQDQSWKTKGLFSVEGTIKGDFNQDEFSSSFEKSQTHLLIKLENGSLHNAKHNVAFTPVAFETTITPLSIKLHNLSLQSQKTTLKASGHVSNYLDESVMNLAISANSDLSELQPWIDEKVLNDLKGTAQLDVTIKGPADLEDADFDGSLAIQNVGFYEPTLKYNIKNLGGKLALNKDQTKLENVTVHIEDSDFSVSSATCSPWKTFLDDKKTIQFQATGKSKYINYKDVLPHSDGQPEKKEPLVLPDIFYRLDGKGNYDVSKVLYSGTDFTDVKAGFTLKKGKLNINPLSVNTFDGTFRANGLVDFTPKDRFPFDMKVAIQNASVRQALTFATSVEELVHLKKSLSAKVSLETNAKGELTNYLELNIPKLTSDGKFSLKDANLKNHPVQNKLSTYLSSSELKEFNVKQWSQKFRVKDGKVHVDDLNLKAMDFAFAVDGYQSLDGSQSYNLKATLPEKYKNKIKNKIPNEVFNLFFKSDASNFTLPFNIGGTYNSPKLSLDEGKMRSDAKNNAKQKVKSDLAKEKKKTKESIKKEVQKNLKEKDKKDIKDFGKKIKKLF